MDPKKSGLEVKGWLNSMISFLYVIQILTCRRPHLMLLAFAAISTSAQTYYWNPNPNLLSTSSGEAQKTFNWTRNMNGTGPWPKSAQDDDFSSGTLGLKWNFVDSTKDLPVAPYNFTDSVGQLTLRGRGTDIWLTHNSFTAVYRNDLTGNFDVSVKVTSQTAASDWSKAGILIYNDFKKIDSGGAFDLFVTPDHGIKYNFDTAGSDLGNMEGNPTLPGTTSTKSKFPVWLRVVKVDFSYSAYYKTNLDSAWILLGSCKPQNTSLNAQVGLFMTDQNQTVTDTVTFDDFQAGTNISQTNLDLNFGSGTSASAQSVARLTAPLSLNNLNMAEYTGTFSFLTETMTVSGNALFGETSVLNPGSGALTFNGNTGTQMFSYNASSLFPAINKSGVATLKLVDRRLHAGILNLAAGVVDLGSLTHEFAGLVSTGGSFVGLSSADTLIISGNADFSGVKALPSSGNVQIRSQGNGKIVSFKPGTVIYPNLYLWAYPTDSIPTLINVGAGNLRVKERLYLGDQKTTAGYQGIVDFRSNTNVSADSGIFQTDNGLAATRTLTLRMGKGTWTTKGNVFLSFANSGSADTSTLNMMGSATQLLSISGGALSTLNHSGTGILQLVNPLSAGSLNQSSGTLDFNGFNLTLSSNLQVTNGVSTTLMNLGGRTLNVGGKTSFVGTLGNQLNMNPVSAWNMISVGALTADFADIGNSAATLSLGKATINCKDKGANIGWTFMLSPKPAVIVSEPADTAVLLGKKATFTTVASGSDTLAYRWFRKGATTILSTTPVLTLNAALAADDGSLFFCVVTNAYGADTTRPALFKVHVLPTLVRDIKDTVVAEGKNAFFTIGALGTAPLIYNWYLKGDTTSLSSDSSLTLPPLALTADGKVYYCVVKNAYGQVTSHEAKLYVARTALIVSEPSDRSVKAGGKFSLMVRAIGANPLVFQWTKKGDSTVISTDSILTLDSVKISDNGTFYSVIVSNAFGKDTSREAALHVFTCDSLFQVTPESLSVDEGQPVVLESKATCSEGHQWIGASGPTPRIIDPEVLTLAFKAPRVTGDSILVYHFTAQYGTQSLEKSVTVRVKNVIPDPQFSLPALSKWVGGSPFVIKPILLNASALKAAPYSPALRYLWTLSDPIMDTAQGDDSLVLSKPIASSSVDIELCMDNGGAGSCHTMTVDVNILKVSISKSHRFSLGPIELVGNTLAWNSSAHVRISTVQGHCLLERRGRAGDVFVLPTSVIRQLTSHRARLEIKL